ncbi:LmbE family N-acetylglucosaminyl deacetylase [Bacillus tianshenii]|uniref:LmbE family N-acetylglucosaminyl deacetylase n=1 Tax=Sutcliffiella tianshenii TaxID=1463404 RepID=A0ABS2P1B0_9BACI|nr:PIG-L family deacetylase [Bacillus tianshenii]MBM7620744.1 LmbE family N-acetylglucosaminyl deacetylase [Bacillus tianshenii]
MAQTVLRKGSKKSILLKVSGILILFLLLLSAIGTYSLNAYINDKTVPVKNTLVASGESKNLLAIFAHPDDEIMAAGTLHKLADEGVNITLLYLTKGEAGPTGGIVSQDELGAEREKETKKVAEILNVEHLEILDYPDGGLVEADQAAIKKSITDIIRQTKPSTVITFDDTVGLYGHADHLLTGKLVKEILLEESYGVERFYQMTLPQPMIDTALKISKTFQERYPTDPKDGLPQPTVAIKMASEAREKISVVKAHKTQWEVTGDVQPLHDKLPYWIYYRIFDREYFAEVELD